MKNVLLVILVFLIGLNYISAQSGDGSRKYQSKIPQLNGHSFLSTSYLRSSFTNTSLQADLGFGTTSDLTIPGLDIGDKEILGFQGSILFFNMSVQYQQRFTPWLALFTTLEIGGRIGTSISTIMVDGVNTLAGGEVGWLVRIKETDKLNLSGTIAINNTTGSFLNLAQYVEDFINDVPDASVTKRVPAMTVALGIRGAYAFNQTFGLQFDTKYAFGESLARDKTTGYISAGVTGDVDFYPKSKLPIGLALGYGISSVPEIVMSDGGISNLFLAKVGYTGSDEFEIGMQYTYYNVKLESVDSKPYISKMLLTLKFYF